MRSALYIPFDDEMRDALRRLAEAEQRPPKLQAARLIRDGLVRAGLLDGKRQPPESAR